MSNSVVLGTLVNVELRKIFADEASKFTPWLAEEHNLKLLGDTIGIELELDTTEKPVGPYSADILCRDADSEQWVVIENQIEKTDRSHLGQLLTYAAGLGAVTIVWVAKRFTDEHRAALDWLNAHTDEAINFFGLEIELWKIGDSVAARKFNIVCRPNAFERTVKSSTRRVTDYRAKQLRFWTQFKDSILDSGMKGSDPKPQHYLHFSTGVPSSYYTLSMSRWEFLTNAEKPEYRVQLVFHGSQAAQRFDALQSHKAEIESALGVQLQWFKPEKGRCRIMAQHDFDLAGC